MSGASIISCGYCCCGCGQIAPISKRNRKSLGHKKGFSVSFINGHNGRDKKGSNSPNWKGGKTTNLGYIKIAKPNHSRADRTGYVREHILVCEEALGKPLPPKAVCHHVDGNRSHNKNNNLVICQDRKYHNLIERRTMAYKACGHANWRKCRYCHQYDSQKNLYIKSSMVSHRECLNKYKRDRRKLNG